MNVDDLLVVVPVHDEESVLDDCLAHLDAAVDALGTGGPRVRRVVVLDSCRDDSEAVASRHPGEVVRCEARNVGTARALGVSTWAPGVTDPSRAWVASTDADSRVPVTWLLDHLQAAAEHDLLVGPVLPDPVGLAPAVLREWRRRHTRVAHHVHGANLGVRLSTYLECGGFPPLTSGEDAALVAAARRAGARTTGRSRPVVTSSRSHGRAPAGFAAYLRDLAHEVMPPAVPDADSACSEPSAILVQSFGPPFDGRL